MMFPSASSDRPPAGMANGTEAAGAGVEAVGVVAAGCWAVADTHIDSARLIQENEMVFVKRGIQDTPLSMVMIDSRPTRSSERRDSQLEAKCMLIDFVPPRSLSTSKLFRPGSLGSNGSSQGLTARAARLQETSASVWLSDAGSALERCDHA